VKLPLCVTAAKARIWRRLMFMGTPRSMLVRFGRPVHQHQVS